MKRDPISEVRIEIGHCAGREACIVVNAGDLEGGIGQQEKQKGMSEIDPHFQDMG